MIGSNGSLIQFDWLSSTIVEFEKSINFSHRNLVCSYFSWYDGAGQLQLITEYCQMGSLKKIMETQDLNPQQRINLAIQTAIQINSALAYLKKQNPPIFHRDIKWENVLVDANGWIKLGDLGLAATHDLGQTHTQGAGTPTWLAPEVLQGRQYDYPSDQYSLALCVLRILKGHINNDGTIHIPPECRDALLEDYLHTQLQVDPTKRRTAEEVLEMFKGLPAGALRNVIKLPSPKERFVSPRLLPWRKTTLEERQTNDELKRLAQAFLDAMEEEKDPSVIASALQLFPFVGTWTTKKNFIITRNKEGNATVTQGYLPWNTPAKAAYIRNIQGREREDEDDDGGDTSINGLKPRHRRDSGQRNRPRHADSGRNRKKHTRNARPSRKNTEEYMDDDESEKLTEREDYSSTEEDEDDSYADEQSYTEEQSAEESDIHSYSHEKMRRKPKRTNANRINKRKNSVSYEDDDTMETEEESSVQKRANRRNNPQRKRSRSVTPTNGPIAAALVRHRTKQDIAESAGVSKTQAAKQPALARGPSVRRGSTVELEKPSISDSKDDWKELTIEEKVDKILGSAEWHDDMEQWRKIPRLELPENNSKGRATLRRLLSSALQTDLSESQWVRSSDNPGFARRIWNWITKHNLWQESQEGPNAKTKKRKRD